MSKLGELLFPGTEEGEQLRNNAEFARLHDATILQYCSESIKTTAIALLAVTATVALIVYIQLNSAAVILWVILVSLTQTLGLLVFGWFAKTSGRSDKARIVFARSVALVSGASLASILVFSPQMAIETRSLVSMVLIWLAATTILTSHGINRFCVSFIVPVFVAVFCIWSLDPDDTVSQPVYWLVMLMLIQLLVVYLVLNKKTYSSFLSSLYTQHKLTQAFEAERATSAEKTQLLAAASHDLRQPLHALSLFCYALALKPLDDDSKAIAQRMGESLRALDQELEMVLDIHKLDKDVVSVNKKTVNLTALVNTICDFLKHKAASKNLDIVVYSPAEIYVETDVDLFSGILRNLLNNAVKCTVDGGLAVHLSATNGEALLRVQGTGGGDEMSGDLEESSREKNTTENTKHGPGFSVINRVSELLQVKVELKSVSDEGVFFEVTLPQSIL